MLRLSPKPAEQRAAARQKGLGSAITLGVLSLIFLVIPMLSGRPTHTRVEDQPHKPTFADYGANVTTSPFVGPEKPVPDTSSVAIEDRPLPKYDGAPAWAPSSEFAHKMQQVMVMLIVVGLITFFSLRGIQRYFPQLLRPGGPRRPLMHVLEKQNLAPGINLALVKIGPKTLVLGMTDQSVSNICELSATEWEAVQAEQVAEQAPAPAMSANPGDNYRQILRHYLSILPGMGAHKP